MKKIIALLVLTFSLSAFAGFDLTCAGTEPFWEAELSQTKLSFSLSTSGETITNEVISKEGTDKAFVVKAGNDSITVVLDLKCSDGMSERAYSHTAVYRTDNTDYFGCCVKK